MADTSDLNLRPDVADALIIPPPEYRFPDCPLCHAECSYDGDCLWCEPCDVYWPDGFDRPGRRRDDVNPPCGAEVAPWADKADRYPLLSGHVFRCVLTTDHTSDHAGVRCDPKAHATGDYAYQWARTGTVGA